MIYYLPLDLFVGVLFYKCIEWGMREVGFSSSSEEGSGFLLLEARLLQVMLNNGNLSGVLRSDPFCWCNKAASETVSGGAHKRICIHLKKCWTSDTVSLIWTLFVCVTKFQRVVAIHAHNANTCQNQRILLHFVEESPWGWTFKSQMWVCLCLIFSFDHCLALSAQLECFHNEHRKNGNQSRRTTAISLCPNVPSLKQITIMIGFPFVSCIHAKGPFCSVCGLTRSVTRHNYRHQYGPWTEKPHWFLSKKNGSDNDQHFS